MRLFATFWGQVLHWRFRLFQRHRFRQLVLETVEHKPFLVLPDVFNPSLFRTSAILIKQLDHVLEDTVVLDLGTGSGIGAVFAAQYAQRVVAVDINPEAVRCAQINVLLNRVEKQVTVQQSDLFDSVSDQRFDVILFNPPFYCGEPESMYDHAWRSKDVVARFASALPSHLTADGFALIVLSTNSDIRTFIKVFHDCGIEMQAITRTNLINEVVTVYKLKPHDHSL